MRKKYILMIIGIILLLGLIFTFVYFFIRREQTIPTISPSLIGEEVEKTIVVFPEINWKVAEVNQYTVYGTHLNLSIILEEELIGIKEANLILRSITGTELTFLLQQNNEDRKQFYLSTLYNEGIVLEKFDSNEYYAIVKVITEEKIENNEKINTKDVEHYYLLHNKTRDSNIEYYTLTKENKNQKVLISFSRIPNIKETTLSLKIKDCILPDSIYDVVIDAGHGGADEGASGNGYIESEITLQYALNLKEKLENMGLKVKLTRTENVTRMNTYGSGGRYVIANEVGAKLQLSIHCNSSYQKDVSGVEIYSPNTCDLTLSRNLVEELKALAEVRVSPNLIGKIDEGIYVRNFTEEEIQETAEYAIKNQFEPYQITTNTSYYGIIRESGGICMGAYVDGRNTSYGKNIYWNSNKGVETYLLELGYITNPKEVQSLVNNIDMYTNAIANTVKKYIEMNKRISI